MNTGWKKRLGKGKHMYRIFLGRQDISEFLKVQMSQGNWSTCEQGGSGTEW